MDFPFSGLSTRMFGVYVEKNSKSFDPLKKSLSQSNLKILVKTYVSSAIFFSLVVTAVSLLLLTIFIPLLFQYNIAASIFLAIGGAILAGGISFAGFYTYPFYISNERRRNIDVNLPFATNHMAAVSSSGVPPIVMFRLLTEFAEYGEISNDSRKIIRNVDVFGQDMITSIKSVAEKNPSKGFQELLYSITNTIETGGDLKKNLKDRAEKALFEYKIRRERYIETLSLYADFYTALLIAAPLFLVAILAIMSLIGGSLLGFTIPQVITFGVYVLIPLVNAIFIMFVHLTQPEV